MFLNSLLKEKRVFCLFLLLVSGFAIPAAAQMAQTIYPLKLDAGPNADVIMGPGKGWAAYVCGWDFETPCWVFDQLPTLNAGGCDILYFRINWKDLSDGKAEAFLRMVNAYNKGLLYQNGSCTKPARDPKTWDASFKVIFRVMFCDINHTDPDYPYAAEIYPYTKQLTAFDKEYVELNYTNPTTVTFVQNMNDEIAQLLSTPMPGNQGTLGDCVIGIDAGFMGDWGENHLLMHRWFNDDHENGENCHTQAELYGNWLEILSNIDQMFGDFAQTFSVFKNSPLRLITFFCANRDWYHPCNYTGAKNDMFDVSDFYSYTLRRDFDYIQDGNPYWGYFNEDLTDRIRGTRPSFIEWDKSRCVLSEEVGLGSDFASRSPNFSQLNMCCKVYDKATYVWNGIGQWGIEEAKRSLNNPMYVNFKNLLGYRFQVLSVTYQPGYSVKVLIKNLGDGFCADKMRLTLQDDNEMIFAQLPISGSTVAKIRKHDPGYSDERTFTIKTTKTVSTNPAPWQLGLEIFDLKTNSYIPVHWSNAPDDEHPLQSVQKISLCVY